VLTTLIHSQRFCLELPFVQKESLNRSAGKTPRKKKEKEGGRYRDATWEFRNLEEEGGDGGPDPKVGEPRPKKHWRITSQTLTRKRSRKRKKRKAEKPVKLLVSHAQGEDRKPKGPSA